MQLPIAAIAIKHLYPAPTASEAIKHLIVTTVIHHGDLAAETTETG